jgi:integrase
LLPTEIEKLLKAAKAGRWGHRDATLILVAYRHGLRATEACELEWAQVEFGRSAALHVRWAKGGKASVHPIRGYELRMLTALRKAFPDNGHVFTTERRTPFTTDAINRLIKNTGTAPSCRCRSTSTCCATLAATSWPTTGSIPGRSKIGSATCRSRIPRATHN